MIRGLEDLLAMTIVLPAVAIGLIAALFAVSRILSPEGLQRLSSGFRSGRIGLSQVMAGVVVAALALMVIYSHGPGEAMLPIVLLSVWILAWFVRNWRKEFVFLMGLRDEDFPGRQDKLIWALVLLVLAPIGVWFFRSYRLAHWPEPKSMIHGEFGPEPVESAAPTRPAWVGSGAGD
jgi:hypothetical protein